MSETTYLALMRGINLGSHNRIAMKDLIELFVQASCGQVRTYIQSGNVIFTASPEIAATLTTTIPAAIAERFNYRVPVILRSTDQMQLVVKDNPFPNDFDILQVLFLADLPEPDRIAKLNPDRGLPGTFAVQGQDVYLRLPTGIGTSKLTNAYFDSTLKTIGTLRNWRTVTTLLKLMQE